MFCSNCGKSNVDESRFCTACGAPLSMQNSNVLAPPANPNSNDQIPNTSGMAQRNFPRWVLILLAVPVFFIATAIILRALNKKDSSSNQEITEQQSAPSQLAISEKQSESANEKVAGSIKSDSPTQDASNLLPEAVISAVEQPEGWSVQYQDASCMVYKDISDITDGKPSWRIKMGYLSGNQLIFIFSVGGESMRKDKIPKGSKSWFVIDGKEFEALGITNQDGEYVLPVENRLELQAALMTANTLGIKGQPPHLDHSIDIVSFSVGDIPGAMKWLKSCELLGVEALPR